MAQFALSAIDNVVRMTEEGFDLITSPPALLKPADIIIFITELVGDILPRDSLPRDSLPLDSLPRDTLHYDSLPCNSLLHDSFLYDSSPRDSLPSDSLPHDNLPRDSLLSRFDIANIIKRHFFFYACSNF